MEEYPFQFEIENVNNNMLFLAIENEEVDKIEKLKDNVDNLNFHNFRLMTPLLLSSMKPNSKCLEILLNHPNYAVDFPVYEHYNWTPLIASVDKGLVKNTKLLINKGANVNFVDIRGFNALSLAVKKGNFDCISLLLEAGGTFQSWEKMPREEFIECVKILIKFGYPVDKKGENGETLLSLANKYNCLEIVGK